MPEDDDRFLKCLYLNSYKPFPVNTNGVHFSSVCE